MPIQSHITDETLLADDTTTSPDEPTPTAGPGHPEDRNDPTIDDTSTGPPPRAASRIRAVRWTRVLAYGVLPAVALLLALVAGYLKWIDNSSRDANLARIESVQAAQTAAVRLLSYHPDTADRELHSARDLLTGTFKDSYTSLVTDVVIPGAQQKHITAAATAPAAASVSATSDHAVVLLFVNQTVTVGNETPTDTASVVRVTLDHTDGQWLISNFEPI